METIDAIDRSILAIIRDHARVSNVEVARRVGMAPSAVLERIRKLEARGVIQGYEARLNPKALNRGLLAYIFVRGADRNAHDAMAEGLCRIPDVLEVHHIAGEDCFLVKVRTQDTESLGRLLREGFAGIPSITSTRTTIVLDSPKETSQVPVEPAEPDD